MRSVFLAALLLLLFSGFSNKNNNLPFSILWSGDHSKVYEKKNVLITNKFAYDSLWKALKKSEPLMPDKPPGIDFKKYCIIASFGGDQTNGIRVDSLVHTKQALEIYISRISFSPGCSGSKLLSTPFVLTETLKGKWASLTAKETVVVKNCEE